MTSFNLFSCRNNNKSKDKITALKAGSLPRGELAFSRVFLRIFSCVFSRITTLGFAWLLTFAASFPAQAQAAIDGFPVIWKLAEGDFYVSDDGLNTFSFHENNMRKIVLNARWLTEKDYYTAHFYKTGVFDPEDFEEIAFRVENPSEAAVKMNFVLTDYRQNEYVLTEGTPVLVLRDGESIKEFIPSEWGAAEIPAGFCGYLHILGNPEDMRIKGFDSISSFGLSFTIPKGEAATFFISNAVSVPKDRQTPVINAEIAGDKLVQMPILGETLIDYRVLFNDRHSGGGEYENVKFGIEDNIHGIFMSEEGRLTVTKALRDYHFQIFAEINEVVRVYTNISVYDHWSVGKAESGVKPMHLPSESEVSDIKALRRIDALLLDYRAAAFFRLFFLGIFAGACAFYIYVLRTGAKTNRDTDVSRRAE